MTKNDRVDFDRAVGVLAVAMRERITGDVLDVYFNALKDVEIEPILQAIGQLTKTAKYFPKTGDIRELAKPVCPPYRQKFFNGEPVAALGPGTRQLMGN